MRLHIFYFVYSMPLEGALTAPVATQWAVK